jgi:threonine aldolase
VHPAVLDALARVNTGHAYGYGHDDYTQLVRQRVAAAFGAPRAEVFFVFNGTGANVLSARALCRPWEAVVCSEVAHLNTDEAGAPEAIAGVKLLALPADRGGKLSAADLLALVSRPAEDHFVAPRMLSLTQSTELGALYSLDELRGLVEVAHGHGLRVHVDGARLSNAAAALRVGLGELTTDVGVDIVSFGGTKNGLMIGEAVVVLDPALAAGMGYLHKQSLQLASKMRYLAAQFGALFGPDRLWHQNAAHANAMAARLAAAVEGIDAVSVSRPVQANAVFAVIPARARVALQAEFDFYAWDLANDEVRWMCSWDTTEDDVDEFAAALRRELG